MINGNPRLENTRLSVLDVVYTSSEVGILRCAEEVGCSEDDVRVALNYCVVRQCDRHLSHCGGCSLRNEQDGIFSAQDFVNRFAEVRFVDSEDVVLGSGEGTMIMPRSSRELDITWHGVDGWLIAEKLLDQ